MSLIVELFCADEEQQELLIAMLASAGFDSFEQKDNSLLAYSLETDQSRIKETLENIPSINNVRYRLKPRIGKNWNEEWEQNFKPIELEKELWVGASFHAPSEAKIKLLIQPKMTFGTGHHATTYMMMKNMLHLNFRNKNVLDFGCGTGILALLAKKLNANNVLGIDNDDWAAENVKENCKLNQLDFNFIHGTQKQIPATSFDFILANINRNVIIETLGQLSDCLDKNGRLLISGILIDDQQILEKSIDQHPLTVEHISHKDQWLCMQLCKK